MKQVKLERSTSLMMILAFLFSLGLVAAGTFTSSNHLQILAILPGLFAVYFYLTRPKDQEFVFAESTVEDQFGNHLFEYREVFGLAINEIAPSVNSPNIRGGLLQIFLPHRVLEFPALTTRTSKTVYQNLLEKIPTSGSRSVCTVLQPRLTSQLTAYDDNSVFSFVSRNWKSNFRIAIGPVLYVILLTGIIWVIISILAGQGYVAWAFIGGIAICMSLIIRVCIFLTQLSSNSNFSKLKNSALVISPDGIAMHQGELTGYLKWSEIQGIEDSKRRNLGRFRGPNASRVIAIKIAGAEIPIFDIYDRPLAKIHQCLTTYWTPPVKHSKAIKSQSPLKD
ncbi:hypothetical protein [Planctomicrobium sp. SH527]|uniref:hypothetical protein n=1 Tax=Planctomicrobium sp. SH527 TaxID=3448123 RepID=UPI003F5BDED3